MAPELLVTTQTQRWNPEEFLGALAEAEITARDASTVRTRMRQAAFPAAKILAEFDVAATSVPPATFDYLSSAEWIRAAENVCMIGPAGTGKGNTLIALRIAAVEAGHRVRYFTAAELVEPLYRGLADNSVGRVIDGPLRDDVVPCSWRRRYGSAGLQTDVAGFTLCSEGSCSKSNTRTAGRPRGCALSSPIGQPRSRSPGGATVHRAGIRQRR